MLLWLPIWSLTFPFFSHDLGRGFSYSCIAATQTPGRMNVNKNMLILTRGSDGPALTGSGVCSWVPLRVSEEEADWLHRPGLITFKSCSGDLLLPARLFLFRFPQPSKWSHNFGIKFSKHKPLEDISTSSCNRKLFLCLFSPGTWPWKLYTRVNFFQRKVFQKM